jgi:acyl carrier protein
MDTREISDRIRARLSASAPHLPAAALTEQASLFDLQFLDSLSTVELAVFLEKEFGIRVAAADLNRARFGTIAAIVALVESRISSAPPPPFGS